MPRLIELYPACVEVIRDKIWQWYVLQQQLDQISRGSQTLQVPFRLPLANTNFVSPKLQHVLWWKVEREMNQFYGVQYEQLHVVWPTVATQRAMSFKTNVHSSKHTQILDYCLPGYIAKITKNTENKTVSSGNRSKHSTESAIPKVSNAPSDSNLPLIKEI